MPGRSMHWARTSATTPGSWTPPSTGARGSRSMRSPATRCARASTSCCRSTVTTRADEDTEEPITTQSSYGVVSLDDLSARIDKDISFANTRFGGFTVFEAVQFGTPGVETVASFFNAQFLGETHFENTVWTGQADFTTIFGREVAFNGAHFQHLAHARRCKRRLGRVTSDRRDVCRTTRTFRSTASEIASFRGRPRPDCWRSAVAPTGCSTRRALEGEADPARRPADGSPSGRWGIRRATSLRRTCYDNVIDEFVALKQSYRRTSDDHRGGRRVLVGSAL